MLKHSSCLCRNARNGLYRPASDLIVAAMVWNREAARQQYNIAGWSAGYFDVGDDGHLLAVPRGRPDTPTVDLHALAHAVRDAGLSWPVLLRFTDILHQQLDRLCAAFASAIEDTWYPASYTAIYPIKVNQEHHVVEALVRHGGGRIGLEAGSKAELMAVIGIAPAGSRIICNGYKDAEYIRLALLAQRLGHDIIVVIEKQNELALVASIAGSLALRPKLGVRVRLSAATSGNWQNSGGDRAKFGFTAAGILALVEELQQRGLADCVSLLHCHPGSQISSLEVLQTSLREVARTWAALRQAGFPVTSVNVGGGLGVDYAGISAARDCSIDYDMAAYAESVVGCFAQVCRELQLAAPVLMSESGRALTAHHAVLVTDVIDCERVLIASDEANSSGTAATSQLGEAIENCRPDTACILYTQANAILGALREDFAQGRITLAQRARGESLYYTLCHRLRDAMAKLDNAPAELDVINRQLADKYFCNLSVFQSMPDVWGIDQVFPVLPLQRLDETPSRRAILHDLTCDSDGHIAHYVDDAGIESSLPVHELHAGETYLLGFFLLGAYQEILGDMHNLFGDTDAVNVELTAAGGYRLRQPRHGDTVGELLRYVEMQPSLLLDNYRDKMRSAGLDEGEVRDSMQMLEGILSGTTYLESTIV